MSHHKYSCPGIRLGDHCERKELKDRIAELERELRQQTDSRLYLSMKREQEVRAEERERLRALWKQFKDADALEASRAWDELDRALEVSDGKSDLPIHRC